MYIHTRGCATVFCALLIVALLIAAGACIISSLCSLTWALFAYSLATSRSSHQDSSKSQYTWSSMMIQAFWRGGMLASRIAALVLASLCFRYWVFLIFALHSLAMSSWLLQQTTDFCPSIPQEMLYKCLIGSVYFFDFLRLSERQVRFRVSLFYSCALIENVAFYAAYVLSYKHLYPSNVLVVGSVLVLGGSFVGALSMLLHFCMFQHVKTIKLCHRASELNNARDPELAVGPASSSAYPGAAAAVASASPLKKRDNRSVPSESTDKNLLLDNVVQRSDSIDKDGIINASFSDENNLTVRAVVEDNKNSSHDSISMEKFQCQAATATAKFDGFDLEDDKELLDTKAPSSSESLVKQKRRGICSELDLDLDLELDLELADPLAAGNLEIQKRRAICSLTQLGLELVTDDENYVEKSFSLDKLKSESSASLNEDKSAGVIDSLSVKNLLNSDNLSESVLLRGRLGTPVASDSSEDASILPRFPEKNAHVDKVEEETMSHVTSVHDYENVCPLSVARPPWCIRSWRGYTDIETYIHDDSVVRDRRTDTLTSTTFSSDFSDATYTSLRKFMRTSRQDDYLDTLIYDLADLESVGNKAATLEEVSSTTDTSTTLPESIQETSQDRSNLFSARPVVIDELGGMLSLDTITSEASSSNLPELRVNLHKPSSVSSLVATIDEIRRCTADNSPRYVYHRNSETPARVQDFPQRQQQQQQDSHKVFLKKSHLAKVLFAGNDYSNLTFSYNPSEPWSTTGSLVGNSDTSSSYDKLIREWTNYRLRETNSVTTPLINAILSDSPILGPKTEVVTNVASEEDNVYVDMNAFGAKKCSEKDHDVENTMPPEIIQDEIPVNITSILSKHSDTIVEKSMTGRKKVGFVLTDEIIDDMSTDTSSENTESVRSLSPTLVQNSNLSIDKRRGLVSRPRCKFSLLRDRFESSPNKSDQQQIPLKRAQLNKRISVIFNDSQAFETSLNCDKQSLTSNNSLRTDDDGKYNEPTNLREKRRLFLKQVLSPPRFQGWSKKRTFSPNAKIINKAH
ncbi:hypothetical protein TKK_0014895 [Trichogramma kaykai]